MFHCFCSSPGGRQKGKNKERLALQEEVEGRRKEGIMEKEKMSVR